MSTLEGLFPLEPSCRGFWQAMYLEPVVGAGERITVAVAASIGKGHIKVCQAIRPELLECLYGNKAQKMQSMIDWLIDSAKTELSASGTLQDWGPPFEGVIIGDQIASSGDSILSVLQQGVMLSSSLSRIALSADRDEDEAQPRKIGEQWVSSISEEVKRRDLSLLGSFKKRVKVCAGADAYTTFGFLKDSYVSNFGLLVPARLSASLTNVKAKLFDLETFKRSNMLVKPECYELILGVPSFTDPTLQKRDVDKLKGTLQLIKETAEAESIGVFHADSAASAAEHIFSRVA